MEDYESLLCVKNEVFVYQIPARQSNRGYRAADWKLDEPDWTGRLKVTSKGRNLVIKLEDRTSGELFAKCPVDSYPSPVIEQVLDSSRYFVIRIQDDSGRHAFIGLGFADRGDSFDLLVAIQDHFKQVKRDEKQEIEVANQSTDSTFNPGPKLDLGFKEGQTIKLNIATKKNEATGGAAKSRPKGGQAGAILLPPPPGSSGPKLAGPPAPAGARAAPLVSLPNSSHIPSHAQAPQPTRTAATPASNVDLLLDLGPPLAPASNPHAVQDTTSEWDDFTSAVSSKLTIQPNPTTLPAQKSGNTASWENFE